MRRTLSIFFNIDRTYLTGVSKVGSTLSLDYINSTIHKIDFENTQSEETQNGMTELMNIISEMDFKPDEISVTLPSESVLVSKFPGNTNMNEKSLKALVALELRQTYPQFNFDDFSIQLVPMTVQKSKKQMMLAVIITKEDLKTIEDLLEPLGKKISKFDISQMNAHSAFIYNYPEFRAGNIMILGLQGQFMDISVVMDGLPAYYNLIRYDGLGSLQEKIENEYNQIVPNVCDNLDAMLYFGSGMTKTVATELINISSQLDIADTKRLNGFRLMKSSLDERQREYCSRTLQIYPACIGGCLPTKHTIMTL